MSEFASAIISGSTLNASQLESELENEIPSRIFIDHWSSSSIATGTHTQLVSRTVTLEADEVALIISSGNFSCGTTSELLTMFHYRDSTDISTNNRAHWTETSGVTSGQRVSLTAINRIQDQSGSTAIKTMWARSSGSGTIYTYTGTQIVLITKRRA